VPDRPPSVLAEQFTRSDQGVVTAISPTQVGAADQPGAMGKSGAAPAAAVPVIAAVIAGAPDDVNVTEFTTAPGTREIYAIGMAAQGCVSAPCPELFHSADDGATWQRLKASGFSGGTVLLPPTFPTDHRIFASGPNGLQVSSDSGASFSTLVPLSGDTAISPAFGIDHSILIGAVPGWVYRDDTSTTTPLHLSGRPAGHTLSFAFSPDYVKDGEMFVGSSAPDPNNPTQQLSTVSVCVFGKCGDPAVLPGAQLIPTVRTSRTFSSSGVAFAWAGQGLYRSADGGKSFNALTLPIKADVQGVAEDATGGVYVALQSTDPMGVTKGGVYVSHDGGKTWTQVGKDTALAKGASSIVSLGNGRLLAAPAGSGLVCSADAGKTWAKRCPATP